MGLAVLCLEGTDKTVESYKAIYLLNPTILSNFLDSRHIINFVPLFFNNTHTYYMHSQLSTIS